MPKPCKLLLQTHLPKPPDMVPCPLRIWAKAKSMNHMLLFRELVKAVRKPISPWRQRWRISGFFYFFFMDMNSCDWFISSYDLTEALVRCSRLHPHEALAGAGASLSAEKMWLGFLPSCWIQTSWKLRCYWAPKSRLFICFDIQIVSLFPGLLVLIYLLIGSWFNLRFQFSFFLLAPYFYS